MNLPFFNKFNKKIIPLYFLVLVLRNEKAEAVIFEEFEGKVKIVGQKEQYFSASIDEASSEELLEVLDKAISGAESSLPENIQTQKTIFGVKESWTDNDQIKKEHLAKLKNASEELGLVPIGFLVISQAIAYLLQKEEGAPVSAILTEINNKSVTVTLLRAGKNIETKSSEIHDSIPFTVDTLLKHFNVPEILPSRIIIFNGKEDLSQEFISHTWSKSLPFLHFPQITNLPEGFDAKSVLFGAATQMGFEVLEKDMPAITKTQNETETQNFSASKKLSDLARPSEPEGRSGMAAREELLEKPTLYKNLEASDFGFVKDVDVAKIPATTETQNKTETQNFSASKKLSDSVIARETFPATAKFTKGINILIDILGIVFIALKKINIKNILSVFIRTPKGKLSIVIPAILILTAALIASYFLFLKATIEITVDPKITEKTQNVLFSTKANTDSNKSVINGEFVNASQDGSVSTAATGKKDVGTQAKGTVTIFNLSDKSVTLPINTEITSPNGLKFTLDNSITVASASSTIDSNFNRTTKSSTINVNITADQLGKESNLPSGTKFSVASLDASDLIAKNDNPFSGGTKKEVTVVSKNDQNKLEEELPKQLEAKARESLKKQIGQEKALLPVFISATLSKKSLNAKVGDEATQVTLTGTVEFQGISYDKTDLISFSKSLLEKNIEKTQKIDYSNIKTAVLDIKQENDEEIEASLNIKALLLPKIDEAKLTKEIRGKSFKTAEDLLYKFPQVSDIDIYFSPNLPLLPKKLPAREKNIKFKILTNG